MLVHGSESNAGTQRRIGFEYGAYRLTLSNLRTAQIARHWCEAKMHTITSYANRLRAPTSTLTPSHFTPGCSKPITAFCTGRLVEALIKTHRTTGALPASYA
jgi:hypothetical protein